MEQFSLFFERLTTDNYPAIVAVSCIPFIIGILAIAFPILSGQRNAINAKYSSEKIAVLFSKERRYKNFKLALPLSLLLLLIYLLQFPRVETSIEMLNTILDYSAVLLLFLSTIFLVISLFGMMSVIEVYNSPQKLLRYYKKKYNKKNDDKWITAISEIFYFSIRTDEEILMYETQEFISSLFIEKLKRNNNYQVEYPQMYYQIIDKGDDLLINKQKERPFPKLGGALMLELLIANYENVYFSEETFSVIWGEVQKAIFYENDKMIYSYWTYAHQYMTYQLSDNRDTIDQTHLDDELRKKHRERFKEFHYMMGTLLLYCKRYDLLERIIYFTQTFPPSYKLVPSTMHELILDYIAIKKDDWSYRQRYSFPNISGVDSSDIMVMWLEKYFSILFLRQYNIYSTHKKDPYGLQQSDLPDLPESVRELNYWKERIDRLKNLVGNYETKEYEVIKALGFEDFLKEDEYIKRNQVNPQELLGEYISSIDAMIPVVEKEREIDPRHREQFEESTLKIIRKAIETIQPLLSETEVVETIFPYSNYIGNSDMIIMDKGAWTNDVTHLNYDTILAENVFRDIKYFFSVSFALLSKNRIYKIPSTDIFDAVKKLEIREKNNYIIASSGFHLEYYMRQEKYSNDFTHIEKNVYKFDGIEVVDMKYADFESIGQSLFVLKKRDLPELRKHELSQEMVGKYHLNPIGESEERVYCNVVDLYRDVALRADIESWYQREEDLEKFVAVYIGLNYEIRWPKGASCILIQAKDDVDSLADVLPMD